MTREDLEYAIKSCGCFIYRGHIYYEESELMKAFEDMGLIEQEPCEDAVSRQGDDRWLLHFGQNMAIPSAEPQTEQFAKWVATEIFDDMWEYNKDSFAEIACRKLEKLGIVKAKGDKWELIESKESDHTCHTCKHYTSGEHDGSCGSYICKGYSDWESEDKE